MTPKKNEKTLTVKIINEQEETPMDFAAVKEVCRQICLDAKIRHGRIEILITDNSRIHELNRQFLQHDYPTDVISFDMGSRNSFEGCIAVSAEMARERCAEFHWNAHEELLLYIIHGTLHLIGYDDHSPHDIQEIREKETFYLKTLGIQRKE
ncbi:MAG: rRNA maturation RNase YbeY [Planctomycetaceae bacterium]|jgi:probable rRNA maturation factor|nr:rRNA maturation RNase YbeY [Planctomycetaceae bacterium]